MATPTPDRTPSPSDPSEGLTPPAEDGIAPLDWLTTGLNAVGTAMILGLMVLINADVIGRNFFRAPVPGVVEMVEAAIVIIVFLQVGHTLRVGRFTRSDGLFMAIAKRRPRVAAGMDLFYALTGAVLFGIIAVAAWQRFREALEFGYFAGIQGAFTLPTWPVELAISLGSGVMVVQFLAICWLRVNEVRRRTDI
ncbi:MAG: TRAP transporter small permease [Pseudomonadota bacterium]